MAIKYDFYTSTDDFEESKAHVGIYVAGENGEQEGGPVAIFYIEPLGVDVAEDLAIAALATLNE